jgi:uncharacterized protein (TIGR02271 family)
MDGTQEIREGMRVYSSDDRQVGTVEKVDRKAIRVNGRDIADSAIARVAQDRVYLSGVYDEMSGGAGMTGQGTIREEGTTRIPVYEERLDVEKRQAELGEVRLHKTVEQEEVSVPVELRREEVHVDRRDVQDRPIEPGAADMAFQETTIRVPVRGEEAVVDKQAFVTGEVVVTKEQTTERQEVRDTVRRERVDIDDAYQRFQPEFQRHFQERRKTRTGDQANWTFDEAEPAYRTGLEAAYDERFAGRRFEEVEPELRKTYRDRWGSGRDRWQELREEIREAYNRARM